MQSAQQILDSIEEFDEMRHQEGLETIRRLNKNKNKLNVGDKKNKVETKKVKKKNASNRNKSKI
jgi:hypothetical protein